jgi:hypothetical protein
MDRDVLGSWFSTYQQYQQADVSTEWVEEKIDIRDEGGKVLLESSDNSIDEHCLATAELRGQDLVGEWTSVRQDGGRAQGGMLLTVLPAQGVIYGVFSGPRDTGERIYGAWVMARKEEDLAEGKRLVGLQILQMKNA